MRPTRSPGSSPQTKYINVTVKMSGDAIIIKSGGSVFKIPLGKEKTIYVLPRDVIEQYGTWDNVLKKYIVLSRVGDLTTPVMVEDTSEYNKLTIKYSGTSVVKAIETISRVLSKYYRGQRVLKLPLSDRNVLKMGIILARMANLQPISDVI
jgi:hypothetical protein